MRAARYIGAGSIDVVEVDPTDPGPAEVQIEVAYTGICGTDLHILHGAMDHRVRAPQVIGHEMSGRVASLGADVTGWSVGQPVTVMPLRWCGRCPACRAGNQHICERLVFVGIDSPGAMQTRWTVSADLLVALPDALALDAAALVEPTAVAVHDVRRAGLAVGETAAVIGGGPIGVLIALVSRAAGADVTVFELDAHRRGVAERLGLRVVDPGAVDLAAFVDDWTRGAGAAVAFEVSGSGAGLSTAVATLAVRGRLVMVAIHNEPRPIDLFRFFWRELTMVGARVYERTDYDRAIRLIARGDLPVGELISDVVPLDRAGDAFRSLGAGGPVMKVLIDCAPGGGR
ncbi:zinc-dependent alcohol dehydrogenase [Asanoa siamensis]|uniref:Zn-dependent alcohol dehydrogenase n=1 Tax=Asanoa siamensis TaxID=926357 RepID=A0ABQ4D3H3_9ACTN|nr:alcohol dehydrogenase catalytic domain-containing protein [Asanoa siamensis]GIF77677.1 Zn-dependent alcohol dehydrogenase [Asanoa siamensis]